MKRDDTVLVLSCFLIYLVSLMQKVHTMYNQLASLIVAEGASECLCDRTICCGTVLH